MNGKTLFFATIFCAHFIHAGDAPNAQASIGRPSTPDAESSLIKLLASASTTTSASSTSSTSSSLPDTEQQLPPEWCWNGEIDDIKCKVECSGKDVPLKVTFSRPDMQKIKRKEKSEEETEEDAKALEQQAFNFVKQAQHCQKIAESFTSLYYHLHPELERTVNLACYDFLNEIGADQKASISHKTQKYLDDLSHLVLPTSKTNTSPKTSDESKTEFTNN